MKTKCLHIITLVLGIACLTTGCGGFGVQSGKNNGAVSGGAVSGEAVSGAAVDAEEKSVTREKFRYSNDDNFYYVKEDENELYQYKLDGTRVDMSMPKDVAKRMSEDCFDLLWVDNEWIYYSFDHDFEVGNSVYEFWRVPIEKQKDGDHLIWSRKEKLVSKKNFWISEVYVQNNIVVYSGIEEKENEDITNYYKLDLISKEEIPLWEQGKNTVFCSFLSDEQIVSAEQGGLFLQEEELEVEELIALYYLDLQKWEIRRIYEFSGDTKIVYMGTSVVNGDFFYAVDDSVWRYRKGEDKAYCLIQTEKIEKAAEEFYPWKGGEYDYWIHDIFSGKERIYLQIGYRRSQKELAQAGPLEGSEADVRHEGYLMLSCGIEDTTDLKYETGITQCMEEQAQTYGEDQQFYEWRGVLTYYACHSLPWSIQSGENLYMSISVPEKDTDIVKWICYNMETGKSKVLDKTDEEARRLFYMGYALNDLCR